MDRTGGSRAPCDTRPARRLPRAGPRGRRRLRAGGDRHRSPARRRARVAPGLPPRLHARPRRHGVEAVHGDRERPVPNGRIDHLWLRVRDPQAARRFYTTSAGSGCRRPRGIATVRSLRAGRSYHAIAQASCARRSPRKRKPRRPEFRAKPGRAAGGTGCTSGPDSRSGRSDLACAFIDQQPSRAGGETTPAAAESDALRSLAGLLRRGGHRSDGPRSSDDRCLRRCDRYRG